MLPSLIFCYALAGAGWIGWRLLKTKPALASPLWGVAAVVPLLGKPLLALAGMAFQILSNATSLA